MKIMYYYLTPNISITDMQPEATQIWQQLIVLSVSSSYSITDVSVVVTLARLLHDPRNRLLDTVR